MSGEGFGANPAKTTASKAFVNGLGSGVAWSGAKGDGAKGRMFSKEFQVSLPYINFLINGARDNSAVLGVDLLVDGKVVRSASATEERGSTGMEWRTWDVRDLEGKMAIVRINDQSEHGWLVVDDIRQSDEAKSLPIDASVAWHESLRPQFHLTAPRGWLSDANGLLYYKGTWHVFYQHRFPGSNYVVWGHATSTDLLEWKHRPVAIPSGTGDSNFSGSGLVDWENASGLGENGEPPLLLFYTLHPNKDKSRKCVQHLAYSVDGGTTWRNFAGNPILKTDDYFDRDPGVFWHKESRAAFLVLSLSKNNTDRPAAEYGIYRSTDFKQWELMQKLGPNGWFWECPDMFEMPVDGDHARMKWILMKASSDYIIGSFDGKKFIPENDKIKLRWGGNYYATQTFSDAPAGRRVQIGWMNTDKPNWANSFPGMPFNQQMSCPRELTLRGTDAGPRIYRYPVREFEQLRVKTIALPSRNLPPGENALAGVWPELLDIEFEFDVRDAKRIALRIGTEEITYDVMAKKLNAFKASAPLAPDDGLVKLRVLIDRTSLEVFGNDGACDLSGVFYTTPDKRALSLTAAGGGIGIKKLAVHELRSIWRE